MTPTLVSQYHVANFDFNVFQYIFGIFGFFSWPNIALMCRKSAVKCFDMRLPFQLLKDIRFGIGGLPKESRLVVFMKRAFQLRKKAIDLLR